MNVEDNLSRFAVLLLAFGGPRSLPEVPQFLERLLGEKPSPAQIEGLQRRYQAIGNASPLPEMTMRQARALEGELKKRRKHLPVYCGMRYSQPLIAETLAEIKKEEISRIILISLSPYTSEGHYAEAKRAVATWNVRVDLIQVADWHNHPGLCAAWANRINDTFRRIPEEKGKIPIVFTAHSLPLDVASNSLYVKQLEETIVGIIQRLGPVRWHLAFQSKGRGGAAWLGPEPEAVLSGLSQKGFRKALICPIGFISDHLETLYDLDIVLKGWAAEQRIEVIRTPCLNDAPELIEALSQMVEKALEKR
jgi:ferrochelatase